MSKQIDTLISQYNHIRGKILTLTAELDFLRNKIAKQIKLHPHGARASVVNVKSCVVREHKRRGYSYIKL